MSTLPMLLSPAGRAAAKETLRFPEASTRAMSVPSVSLTLPIVFEPAGRAVPTVTLGSDFTSTWISPEVSVEINCRFVPSEPSATVPLALAAASASKCCSLVLVNVIASASDWPVDKQARAMAVTNASFLRAASTKLLPQHLRIHIGPPPLLFMMKTLCRPNQDSTVLRGRGECRLRDLHPDKSCS